MRGVVAVVILLTILSMVLIGRAPEPHSHARRVGLTLPIPPRIQWRDRAGYCGECSIQQAALYYGGYVSQFVCRQIIDPDQQQDVLIRVNADVVFEALRLEYDEFETAEEPIPQYESYLAWTKQHLHQGHPVIITVFCPGDSCWDYDHIVTAVGFQGRDVSSYHPGDLLIINDNFDRKPHRRRFHTLHDSREMRGNGAAHEFCIPTIYNFGSAITGVADDTDQLLPVRVTVDQESEPDVVKGVPPVLIKLTATVSELMEGKSYVLYCYDDYKSIPISDYAHSTYKSVRTFVAKGTSQVFHDKCLSNGLWVYRCLPLDDPQK
ncbi:MAG: hypothetical protein JSS49_05200 [Planctomycetes bacterium]|nr:hypothetical protein [Planctomycetota bacterium]